MLKKTLRIFFKFQGETPLTSDHPPPPRFKSHVPRFARKNAFRAVRPWGKKMIGKKGGGKNMVLRTNIYPCSTFFDSL